MRTPAAASPTHHRLCVRDAASAQLVSKHWRSLWLAAKPMLKVRRLMFSGKGCVYVLVDARVGLERIAMRHLRLGWHARASRSTRLASQRPPLPPRKQQACVPIPQAACPAVIGRTSLGYELSLGRPVGPTAAEAAAALAAALRARGAASVESLHLKVAATDGGGRPAVLDTARLWRAALAACPAVRDLRIELRDHEWRGLVEVLPW